MKKIARIFGALLVVAGGLQSHAQDAYPNKPVRLIVPFPAGGALDSLARPIAVELGKRLGQPVLIDNKPGGNLMPATVLVTGAAPDGYTLYYTLGQPYSTNQFLFKSLPYDVTSYTAIAPIAQYLYTFQVGANSPFKSLKELVDYAKKNPQKLNFATPGSTSAGRLAAERFLDAAGIKMTQVPFQGGAAQSLAVAGGQVEFMVGEASSSNPFMRGGQVKTFAINDERRLESFPDVPTLAEAGFSNIKIPNPYAVLVGPKGMPDAIVNRLAADVAAVMETESVKAALNTLQIRPLRGGPAQARALITDEARVFGPVIKTLNISVE